MYSNLSANISPQVEEYSKQSGYDGGTSQPSLLLLLKTGKKMALRVDALGEACGEL